jgi:sulfoxide reductase heme-binding subunit YedZ
MIAALSTSTMWYLTRGAGLVSLVLLTATVVMGIVQVQRWAGEGWPRMVIAGLHKNISLLVLVFLALHIVTAIVDGFVPIHWISVLIPFTSSYRPLWLGLGAVAVDLLIALIVTSLLRSRLSVSTWRLVHWSAYACWPIAFVHGLGTGSDGRVQWVIALDALCLGAVVAATGWRLYRGWQREPVRRAVGSAAMVVMVLAVLGWAAAGPTKAGWARKAGTPTRLLASGTSTTEAGTDPGASDPGADPAPGGDQPSTVTPLTTPYSGTLSGTIAQTGQAGQAATATIDGTVDGNPAALLHIEIDGTAAANGGLRMRSSAVTLGPSDQPDQFQGTIVSLRGSAMTISLQDASGNASTLSVQLQIDEGSSTVSGTVSATAGAPPRGEDD